MKRTARPAPLALADGLVALAFAAAYVALLLATAGDLGYARDEGFYFFAADRYASWFKLLLEAPRAALAPEVIDAAWSVNHEHPGLIKSLFALSNLLLQQRLGLFAEEGTSYRFPAMVLSGAGVALVYLWGAQARDRIAGACAAVLFAMLPRYFYHAHLACFDAPVVTVWALCAYCYWRALQGGGLLWPVLTGVAFGLALDTKHNSWFLPIVCVAHAIAVALRERIVAPRTATEGAPGAAAEGAPGAAAEGAPPASSEPRPPLPPRPSHRALAALAAMATLGPLVFFALWPWIWHDTLPRLREYASFHLNHEYYNMEFLGRNHWTPPMPRAYAPVMTAATVPLVTLVLFVAGLCAGARERLPYPLVCAAARLAPASRRPALVAARALAARLRPPADDPGGTALLWFLSIAAIYGAWLSPRTPIFGGTKHWMTAYPFMALFAGAAFSAAVRRARIGLRALSSDRRGPGGLARRAGLVGRAGLARAARGLLLPALLGAAVVAAPIAETLRAHPWALSSYTPLVGGAPGAATLGLNRTFWGYTTGAVVAYLNAHVPPRGTVYIHDTAGPAWDMLLRDGRLRKDIRGVGTLAGADFALYHHEKHMLGQAYQAWVAFGTTAPEHIAGLDGVPVILVYRNPAR
ncbi:hypothetical protein SOCEGT47_036140 [Sorangium cellulosum]|uniref:Glycosyltransferase RgtA/B/C/D-like domain-containing protein n=1 Tax=Sorangium cellulosum TaxID=56 RepID=A0A4P2Q1G1_SORCE|nr:glycosyltransferase family 39 protein [Sorangium cellulosum]AUX23095.1 hypothetical protein SOCEGT47_036140 [Sorangium cellulosum]